MGICVLGGFFMKIKLTSLFLAIIVLVGVFCGCSGGSNTTHTSAPVATDTAPTQTITSPDETGAIIGEIPGFVQEDIMGDMITPYEVPEKGINVVAVGTYNGAYIEEIDDVAVENVMAIVVQNTADKPVQSATVTVASASVAEDGTETTNEHRFVVTTLPAGSSALVLEAEKKSFPATETITDISANVTNCESFSLNSDIISVSQDGTRMVIENLTETDYRMVLVRYKNYTAGNVYLGGITYSATFDTVAALESYDQEQGHFSEGNSVILKVEIVE